MRAKKGVAAMLNGTTAAQIPIDVPTIRRVNGMSATRRMMNGVERKPLMMLPSTRSRRGIS